MEDDRHGIGMLLGVDDTVYMRHVMRPMMMELMLQVKRELRIELTAQMRREMRALIAHLKRDDGTIIGPLVPPAEVVADERGRLGGPAVMRRRMLLLVALPEEDWRVAMRKFNKAD